MSNKSSAPIEQKQEAVKEEVVKEEVVKEETKGTISINDNNLIVISPIVTAKRGRLDKGEDLKKSDLTHQELKDFGKMGAIKEV